MAYAITKAGVRWFLDSYPMPMPLNLMALEMKQALSIVKGLKLNIVDGYNLIAEANRRKKQMRFL